MGLLFLVDEDSAAPATVAALQRHGHTVYLASLVLSQGASDLLVVKHADEIGAIVLTKNRDHFWKYLAPTTDVSPRKFKRAGGLFMMCEGDMPERRLDQFNATIEAEHDRVMREADPRLLIEIRDQRFIILR